jgi:CelD/BcsL family acetyltransferase involved in cellulose biosynthesis
VAPDPFGELGLRAAGVELDFVPVSVLEEFGVGEAEFLGARVSDESMGFVSWRKWRGKGGEMLPESNVNAH